MVNDMLDVVLLSSLLCCSSFLTSFSYQISSSTGTGPKRVYQFKLIEKEPWGNEPKQLCKLGSTDLRVIKFLRTTIAERVASKY
jgi:hypothetical protein